MPTSEEFGKDWYLNRKIALLWWVEPSHFDIVLDYSSLEVTHKIEQAKAGQYGRPSEHVAYLLQVSTTSCTVRPSLLLKRYDHTASILS